jgi:hypothetical protein
MRPSPFVVCLLAGSVMSWDPVTMAAGAHRASIEPPHVRMALLRPEHLPQAEIKLTRALPA